MPLPSVLDVRGSRSLRLRLPLFLIWLLPILLVALLIGRVKPWRPVAAFWAMLEATRGTHVEVSSSRIPVFVHIY